MKYMISVLVMASMLSCKMENKTKEMEVELDQTKAESSVDLERYPEPLKKIFEAHGGLANWKGYRSLAFKHGEELHTIQE